MVHRYTEIAFTPNVKRLQESSGSRRSYARLEAGETDHDKLGAEEAAFIADRDSFYMATVGETGWPYIQHRGGPVGFVRILDEKTIAFSDFVGNRQYISVGNLQSNNRVSIFFMDYPGQTRLKIFGHARLSVAGDPESPERLQVANYRARIERTIIVSVEGFDWNCPQHIVPRFTQSQVLSAITPLNDRISELEAALAELRHLHQGAA